MVDMAFEMVKRGSIERALMGKINSNEADRVIRFFSLVYRVLSCVALSFILPLILMMTAVLLDFCPYEYKFNLEHIFMRADADYAVIAPLAFVIWAFTASLVLFYIERFEEKHYGVRLIDLICEEFRPMKLCGMILVFFLELLTLFWSTVYKKEITFFVSVVLQIGTMVYVFLMICVERSRLKILDRIKQQTRSQIETHDHINWMLEKMLRNTDYSDEQDVDVLIKLIKDVTDEIDGNAKQRQFISCFTDRLLAAIADSSKAKAIVRVMMSEWKSVYAKQGIITSLIDKIYELSTPDITDIINIEFDERKTVIIWGLTYNGFRCFSDEGSVRRELTDRIWESMGEPLSDDDRLKMYGYWKELNEDNANNTIVSEKLIGKEAETEELHLDKLWSLMYPSKGEAL